MVSHESQLQEYSPSSQQPSDKSASAVYQESPPQPPISPHTATRDEVLHSEAVELSRCIIDSMVSVIVSVSAVAEQRHYPNIEVRFYAILLAIHNTITLWLAILNVL